MYFHQAEDDALADVSVGVPHQGAERVGQLQQVLDQFGKLLLSEVLSSGVLVHQLLNVSQLILYHTQEGLEARGLLCAQQLLESLGKEVRVASYYQPLKQVFGDLIGDALMLRSNVGRVCLQSAQQNVLAVLRQDRAACSHLRVHRPCPQLGALDPHLVPVPLLDDVRQSLDALVSHRLRRGAGAYTRTLYGCFVGSLLHYDEKQRLDEELEVVDDQSQAALLARRVRLFRISLVLGGNYQLLDILDRFALFYEELFLAAWVQVLSFFEENLTVLLQLLILLLMLCSEAGETLLFCRSQGLSRWNWRNGV